MRKATLVLPSLSAPSVSLPTMLALPEAVASSSSPPMVLGMVQTLLGQDKLALSGGQLCQLLPLLLRLQGTVPGREDVERERKGRGEEKEGTGMSC